jgi:hypothetical protein
MKPLTSFESTTQGGSGRADEEDTIDGADKKKIDTKIEECFPRQMEPEAHDFIRRVRNLI